MNLPSPSAAFVIVSRYAICGAPVLASTLNSRFKRSMMISRCNSPMPAMMSWLVSSFVKQRKVGSSSARRCKPSDNLSRSCLVFGSTAIEITGSGEIDGFRSGLQTCGARDIERTWQLINDCVHQNLNAFFLEGRTAQHGNELDLASEPADGRLQRDCVNRFVFQNEVGNGVVLVGNGI